MTNLARGLVLLAICVFILIALMIHDYQQINMMPLERFPPDFGPYFILRFVIIFSCALIVLLSVWWHQRPNTSAGSPRLATLFLISSFVLVTGQSSLLVINRTLYRDLSYEDGVVEYATTVLALAAAITLFVALLKARSIGVLISKIEFAFGYFLCVFLFVYGMEEISWGQRIFGFDTPPLLSTNEQNEANIHNLFTDEFNIALHILCAFSLVLMPFFCLNKKFKSFMFKDTNFIILTSITSSMNFTYWNTIFVIFIFFGTIICIITLIILYFKSNLYISFLFFISLLINISQQVFMLIMGHTQLRYWGHSEWREFLFALCFFVLSVMVVQRVRKIARASYATR